MKLEIKANEGEPIRLSDFFPKDGGCFGDGDTMEDEERPLPRTDRKDRWPIETSGKGGGAEPPNDLGDGAEGDGRTGKGGGADAGGRTGTAGGADGGGGRGGSGADGGGGGASSGSA